MIKSQHLMHALAALELGSFKKAAEAHHISEPAFSRSIANLEQSLGVRLFSRSPQGVTATIYGQLLCSYGEKVIDTISELEREIRLRKGLEIGELCLAFGSYPSEISCHTALAHLIEEYPDIRCKVTVADWQRVEKLVENHDVDLGIAETSAAARNKHLVIEPLNRHKFFFYCRSEHPLLKKRNINKQDFEEYPSAFIRVPARLSQIFPCRLFPVEHTDHAVPSIELQDVVLAKELVLKSNAISAATPCQIRNELEAGLLSVIPFVEPWMTLNYGFMYMKDRTLSPVAEAYVSFVKEVEKEVTECNEELMRKYLM